MDGACPPGATLTSPRPPLSYCKRGVWLKPLGLPSHSACRTISSKTTASLKASCTNRPRLAAEPRSDLSYHPASRTGGDCRSPPRRLTTGRPPHCDTPSGGGGANGERDARYSSHPIILLPITPRSSPTSNAQWRRLSFTSRSASPFSGSSWPNAFFPVGIRRRRRPAGPTTWKAATPVGAKTFASHSNPNNLRTRSVSAWITNDFPAPETPAVRRRSCL